jgi:hypothetical protein
LDDVRPTCRFVLTGRKSNRIEKKLIVENTNAWYVLQIHPHVSKWLLHSLYSVLSKIIMTVFPWSENTRQIFIVPGFQFFTVPSFNGEFALEFCQLFQAVKSELTEPLVFYLYNYLFKPKIQFKHYDQRNLAECHKIWCGNAFLC